MLVQRQDAKKKRQKAMRSLMFCKTVVKAITAKSADKEST